MAWRGTSVQVQSNASPFLWSFSHSPSYLSPFEYSNVPCPDALSSSHMPLRIRITRENRWALIEQIDINRTDGH